MTDEAAAQATTDEQTQEPTALQQAAQESQTAAIPATTAATTATPADRIPEKFRTMRADGTIDLEASSAKMAESYSYLEKKLGSGEAPPKSPDEYQVTFSEDAPITFDDIKGDPQIQDFIGEAHKLGMTNAQVSMALDKYLKVLPQDLEAYSELTAQETVAQLKADVWKSDAELKQGLSDAYRAVSMVAGDDADYLMNRFGNDPKFIQFVAKFGEGLREDSPPQAMQMLAADDFNEAKMSLAQQLVDMAPNDPRRAAILKKQTELYERQVGTQPAYGLG